jgi:hypothetical protein
MQQKSDNKRNKVPKNTFFEALVVIEVERLYLAPFSPTQWLRVVGWKHSNHGVEHSAAPAAAIVLAHNTDHITGAQAQRVIVGRSVVEQSTDIQCLRRGLQYIYFLRKKEWPALSIDSW